MESEQKGPRRRGRPSTPRKDEAVGQTIVEAVEQVSGEAAQQPKGAEANKKVATKKLSKLPVDFSGPLQKALAFMEKDKFSEAAQVLQEALHGHEKEDKDAGCLHNLAVCYSELGAFAEAEEVFWDAFERSPKDSFHVFKTMYGLASCLTAQDDPCKLLQAEALLREILDKGLQQEGLVEDIYRSYVLLAENLGRQRKWSIARECWEAAVQMGANMFGEDHELVARHRISAERARRLACWQGRLRIVMWSVCIAVPVIAGYFMYGRWVRAGQEPELGAAAGTEPQLPPEL